jgi:hypothetical protein
MEETDNLGMTPVIFLTPEEILSKYSKYFTAKEVKKYSELINENKTQQAEN